MIRRLLVRLHLRRKVNIDRWLTVDAEGWRSIQAAANAAADAVERHIKATERSKS